MGTPSRSQLESNIRKILTYNFFTFFLVVMPIIVPFFKSKGLGMHQIFQLQALFSMSIVVLEVPTGYLSDIWGRKKTLILGAIFYGGGTMVLPFADTFWSLAIFEVLLAVGLSLQSGTDLSILYDSAKALGTGQNVQAKLMGNLLFTQMVAEAIASVLGGLLAYYSMTYTIWAAVIVGWAPLMIALTVVEPPLENKLSHKSHLENAKKIFRHLILEDAVLRLTFFNYIFWSSSTLIMVWAYQQIWEQVGIPLHWYGALWGGLNLASGLIGKRAHLWEARFGAPALLASVAIMPLIGFVSMAALTQAWVVAFGLLFSATRAFNHVVVKNALNHRVPSEFRATANSLAALGVRLVFSILGPAVGYVMDHQGTATAMSSLAAFYAVCAVVLMLPLIRRVRELSTAPA